MEHTELDEEHSEFDGEQSELDEEHSEFDVEQNELDDEHNELGENQMGDEVTPTCAMYQTIIERCKALQARLLLTRATLTERAMPWDKTPVDEEDIANSLKSLESAMNCVQIHEKAVKQAKISQMALEVFSSENVPEHIEELMGQHVVNQVNIVELAREIQGEREDELKVQCELLEKLQEYMASLAHDREEFKSRMPATSVDGLKRADQTVRKIRFMQHVIGTLIAYSKVDLRKNETLKRISLSVRDRTSLESFFEN